MTTGLIVKPAPSYNFLPAREAYGHLRDATHRRPDDLYGTCVQKLRPRPRALPCRVLKNSSTDPAA